MYSLTNIILLLVCLTQTSISKSAAHASEQELAELLWQRMTDALLYIRSTDRSRFLVRCGGQADCPRNIVVDKGPGIQWAHIPTKEEKVRFWQAYTCFKRQSIAMCPVDGGWGSWSSWSRCYGKCGEEGTRNRTRHCDNPHPLNNGVTCYGERVTDKICRGLCTEKQSKTAIDVTEAKKFVKKLNDGFPQLERVCKLNHCSYDQIGSLLNKETQNKYWSCMQCYKYHRACPVDGAWSTWSKWSSCQPKCGQGIRWRRRTCTNPKPSNGGFQCRGSLYKQEYCFGRECSNGDFLYGHYLSDWSPFGSCSVSCGRYGMQRKSRICLKTGECSKQLGKNKNEIVIRKPCYNGPCPGIGTWSSWGRFTPCSAVCGRGRKTRLRQCPNVISTDSMQCIGYYIDTKSCRRRCNAKWRQRLQKVTHIPEKLKQVNTTHVGKLALDKDIPASGDPYHFILIPQLEHTYEQWSAWSACTKTCGGGFRARSRNCQEKRTVCYGEVIQRQFCNIDPCPVSGSWGDWLAWTSCSVTCGSGVQLRYRRCDSPLPQDGGTCLGLSQTERDCNNKKCEKDSFQYGEWEKWSTCSKSCGIGQRHRKRICKVLSTDPAARRILDKNNIDRSCPKSGSTMKQICNPYPCPVNGRWANWGSWSACSLGCGLGQRYRDRTCTDPAPAYGGKLCPGPGTDIVYCFNRPCQDSSEVGAMFNGSSVIKYNARHKPSRYLVMYVLLTSKTKDAVILQRYKACGKGGYCTHNVTLSLTHGIPRLIVKDNHYVLNILGRTRVKHSILVFIYGDGGFMRVDDGKHSKAAFSPKLKAPINFDAKMIVGWDLKKTENLGYQGEIASLRVNFHALSLFASSNWKGYGLPSKSLAIKPVVLESYIGYPRFEGKEYLKKPFQEKLRLDIKLTFFPINLNGVLFFNDGLHPGSYSYMVLDNSVLKVCLKCGEKPVCQDVDTLRSHTWYYTSVLVYNNAAEVRLDNRTAIQLTSPDGPAYRAGSPMWIGGGNRQDSVILKLVTGQKFGFSGFIHDIIINGNPLTLQGKSLMDEKGFINSMGISLADRVDEVFEHTTSKVTMKCDYTTSYNTDHHAKVEWFHEDRRVLASPSKTITQRLPGLKRISSLVLSGASHQGIYSCAVKHNGVFTIQHAFIVIRHNLVIESVVVKTEQWVVRVILVSIPILFFIGLAFAAKHILTDERRKALKPIIAEIKKLYRPKSSKSRDKIVEQREESEKQGEVSEKENKDGSKMMLVEEPGNWDERSLEKDEQQDDVQSDVRREEENLNTKKGSVSEDMKLDEESDEENSLQYSQDDIEEGLESVIKSEVVPKPYSRQDLDVTNGIRNVTESSHGRLTTGFSRQDLNVTNGKRNISESSHGRLTTGFSRQDLNVTNGKRNISESSHGRLTTGFSRQDLNVTNGKRNISESSHGRQTTGFSTSQQQTNVLPLTLSHISPEKRHSSKTLQPGASSNPLPLPRSMSLQQKSSVNMPPPPTQSLPTEAPHMSSIVIPPASSLPHSSSLYHERTSSSLAGLPPPPPPLPQLSSIHFSHHGQRNIHGDDEPLCVRKEDKEMFFCTPKLPDSKTSFPVIEDIPEPPRTPISKLPGITKVFPEPTTEDNQELRGNTSHTL